MAKSVKKTARALPMPTFSEQKSTVLVIYSAAQHDSEADQRPSTYAEQLMDEAELQAQLERRHAMSYGWALSCCARDAAEAEDVLQTVYLKILQGKACFEWRAAFKT